MIKDKFRKILASPITKKVLWVILGLFLFVLLFYISIYAGLWGKVPSSKELKNLKQSAATEVFSSEGKLIGKYYVYDRQPVVFEELPQHLIDALIATEDVRFYEHSGIDSRSLMRVFFKTLLLQDESSGGGSTITLQLAKNLFGRNDYGYMSIVVNKLRESVIAQKLEDIYSKNEILTIYFNTVPFSDNTYGIESASRKFFNRHTSDLTLTQAATLVGTLKANHYYNPRLFPDKSKARRNLVLHQMQKYGYISAEKMEEARAKPIKLDYQYFNHNRGPAPYFREQVRKDAMEILDTILKENGKAYDIYRDGLRIYTTLDYKMQLLAEEAMAEHMAELQEQFEKSYGKNAPWENKYILKEKARETPQYKSLAAAGWSEEKILDSLNRDTSMELFGWGTKQLIQASIIDSLQHYLKFLNVGMINLDPSTGAVKSWIGGINHQYFKYDHVSQSRRQVGSTFKPIVYTTAVEAGIDPCTYYSLREVTYAKGWTPSNATSDEEDPFIKYSMEAALSKSINTIAVKVLFDAGIGNIIAQARKMGISAPLPEVPSLALGTAAIKVEELAGAYSSYVNKSRPVTPYYITRIEDKNGDTIISFEPEVAKKPAFSNTTREVLLEMLQETVNSGTAARLRYKYHLENDMAGKTGTTQDNRDGWFVGITPNLISVTWVGADDHRIGFRNTHIGQGANSALPIFALLMQKMNKDSMFDPITKARFDPPSGTVQNMLNCPPVQRDSFLERLFGGEEDSGKPQQKEDEGKDKKGLFKKIKDIFN